MRKIVITSSPSSGQGAKEQQEGGRRPWWPAGLGRSGDPRAWLRWGIERGEGGELGGGLTIGGGAEGRLQSGRWWSASSPARIRLDGDAPVMSRFWGEVAGVRPDAAAFPAETNSPGVYRRQRDDAVTDESWSAARSPGAGVQRRS
jgi:hypothetical protein